MDMTAHPKWEAQVALEERMRALGAERYRLSVSRAKENEMEGSTDYALRLIKQYIDPLADGLKTFINNAYSGKAGRKHAAAAGLREIDPEVAAFLCLRAIFDLRLNELSLAFVATTIGLAIEDELRMRFYRGEQPYLYDAIVANLKDRSKFRPNHTKVVMRRSMNRVGTSWKVWEVDQKLHVGQKCIDILCTMDNPIIEAYRDGLESRGKRRKPKLKLRLTEQINQWINDRQALSETLTPSYMPTIIPPKPWTSVLNGGYWTYGSNERGRRAGGPSLALVKTKNFSYLEDLRHTEMPLVYEAINAIQNTAWKINRRVFDTITEAWDARIEIGQLPPRDDREIPPMPPGAEEDERALKAWRRRCERVHINNSKLRSKRLQVIKALWIADILKDEDEVFFPHLLDFRGRAYAVSSYLNPQSCDYGRAMLTFAHGKPITNDTARDWLAIHGANCYGYDKASMAARVQWVEDHAAEIVASAGDPIGNRFWSDADKPWQFLAFCFEWAAFIREGYGFVSHLPIALDGTCNGLQHFSAMLRDHVGGEAVNLVPMDKPQDIYQRVADRVIARLQESDDPLAQLWLDYGITRKTTKRPVMILPYGGSLYACRQYTKLHLDERATLGQPHPFGESRKEVDKAVFFLSRIIWSAIGDVVVAARDAMAWLQKLAALAAKSKLPLTWVTPAGFPVRQAYPDIKRRQIKTMLNGSVIKLWVKDEGKLLDSKRQVTGVSPNFVHSMDGAALHLCVCTSVRRGITSFAMIHDSYGTHAADTQALAVALREAFVDIYQSYDVLAALQDSVAEVLPAAREIELPRLGQLDITRVMDSEFFFA